MLNVQFIKDTEHKNPCLRWFYEAHLYPNALVVYDSIICGMMQLNGGCDLPELSLVYLWNFQVTRIPKVDTTDCRVYRYCTITVSSFPDLGLNPHTNVAEHTVARKSM